MHLASCTCTVQLSAYSDVHFCSFTAQERLQYLSGLHTVCGIYYAWRWQGCLEHAILNLQVFPLCMYYRPMRLAGLTHLDQHRGDISIQGNLNNEVFQWMDELMNEWIIQLVCHYLATVCLYILPLSRRVTSNMHGCDVWQKPITQTPTFLLTYPWLHMHKWGKSNLASQRLCSLLLAVVWHSYSTSYFKLVKI